MSAPHLYRLEAVVLKRKNIGEADRLITFFSKEKGKITAVAKGIRRIHSRRGPHLEVFSRVVVMLHRGSRLDTITEVTSLNTFPALRKHLQRVNAAYILSDLIDSLTPEHQEHRDVFEQIVEALGSLEASGPTNGFIAQFGRNLLISLGFLAPTRMLTEDGLIAYIEQVTERRLKTKNLIQFSYGTDG